MRLTVIMTIGAKQITTLANIIVMLAPIIVVLGDFSLNTHAFSAADLGNLLLCGIVIGLTALGFWALSSQRKTLYATPSKTLSGKTPLGKTSQGKITLGKFRHPLR